MFVLLSENIRTLFTPWKMGMNTFLILRSYTTAVRNIQISETETFGKCIKTQTVEQCRILCKTALKFILWMAVFRDKDFSSLASQSVLQKNELLV